MLQNKKQLVILIAINYYNLLKLKILLNNQLKDLKRKWKDSNGTERKKFKKWS